MYNWDLHLNNWLEYEFRYRKEKNYIKNKCLHQDLLLMKIFFQNKNYFFQSNLY